MKKLFGTDGIRGLAGGEIINEDLAFRLGQALVRYCQIKNIKPEIIVGRDTRISGPFLETSLSRGVKRAGGQTISTGVIPTPAIAYLAKSEKAGLGLVISASHNTHEHNGFKIFKNNGTKLTDDEEETMVKLIIAADDLNTLTRADATAAEIKFREKIANNYGEKYAQFLKNISEADNLTGIKIILDCANGATSAVAPEIYEKLGARVEIIFNSPDGQNINKDCGSEHTENLQKAMVEREADIGLAFDGDGDRLIAVTEKGERLTGDHLLYICAKMLKEKNELKNNLVVSTVMSNLGFINGLKNLGIKYSQTDVGDQPVYNALVAEEGSLGGEESGHSIFLDQHTTGDGILSGLMLLKVIKHFNQPLSELAKEFPLMPKILLNFKVKSKPDLSTVPEINQAIKEAEDYFGDQGRVLVRYSGTEPLCRVMIEGRDEKEVKAYVEKIGEVINNVLN